jgi:glycosyltransferase involved in cell wall biosynthesis
MIATWSIVNNEISFIKDVVEYHLTWADAMFILDTGSTDGTWEMLQSMAETNKNLHIEQYHTKFIPQYQLQWHEMAAPFPEVDVRNFAISRAEELLHPDWLIQLDGDEVFLDSLPNIIKEHPEAVCLGHSTINPVCPLPEHPMEERGGHFLYDPHVRIWRAGEGIKYQSNPVFQGKQFHCVPSWNGHHLFHHPRVEFFSLPVHFHLHWMYGKKVELWFAERGVYDREEIVKSQYRNYYGDFLPQVFWNKRKDWTCQTLK